jgi:predicted metal-dependent phosphoesterase TrpH
MKGMKKVDLHIHTIATVSDPAFDFDMSRLKWYVEEGRLDVIAITNHNIFGREQWKSINDELGILVLPGIEIDLEGGHILVIAEPSDIDDFDSRCALVSGCNLGRNESLSLSRAPGTSPSSATASAGRDIRTWGGT